MKTIKQVREKICENCSAKSFCQINDKAADQNAKCPHEAWDTEWEQEVIKRGAKNAN